MKSLTIPDWTWGRFLWDVPPVGLLGHIYLILLCTDRLLSTGNAWSFLFSYILAYNYYYSLSKFGQADEVKYYLIFKHLGVSDYEYLFTYLLAFQVWDGAEMRLKCWAGI